MVFRASRGNAIIHFSKIGVDNKTAFYIIYQDGETMKQKLTWVAEMFSTLVDIPSEEQKDDILTDLWKKIWDVKEVIAATEQNRASFLM